MHLSWQCLQALRCFEKETRTPDSSLEWAFEPFVLTLTWLADTRSTLLAEGCSDHQSEACVQVKVSESWMFLLVDLVAICVLVPWIDTIFWCGKSFDVHSNTWFLHIFAARKYPGLASICLLRLGINGLPEKLLRQKSRLQLSRVKLSSRQFHDVPSQVVCLFLRVESKLSKCQIPRLQCLLAISAPKSPRDPRV